MLQMSGCEALEQRKRRHDSFADAIPDRPEGDYPRKMRDARFLAFLPFFRELLPQVSTLPLASIMLHRDSRNINYIPLALRGIYQMSLTRNLVSRNPQLDKLRVL